MKENKWLYSDRVQKNKLYEKFENKGCKVELVGFVSKRELRDYVISKEHIMKKGILMGKSQEEMKVDNYYVHISDLIF
ncbi:TPA: hypothetical protein ACGPDF_001474 [Streptococcus suis]